MGSKVGRSSQLPWVVALLLGGLLVRGTIAAFLPPGFDEAYYYLYTRHLDWSYFDHPPMVALTTGFGVWLTGQVSPFTIRLGPLLLHTGSLLLLYLTARQLFSEKAALTSLTIATLCPLFLLGFGVLTLPDSPLIFFWTATLLLASQEILPSSPPRPLAPLPHHLFHHSHTPPPHLPASPPGDSPRSDSLPASPS